MWHGEFEIEENKLKIELRSKSNYVSISLLIIIKPVSENHLNPYIIKVKFKEMAELVLSI